MNVFNEFHVSLNIYIFFQDKLEKPFFQIYLRPSFTFALFLKFKVMIPLYLGYLYNFHQAIIVYGFQFFVSFFPNNPVHSPNLLPDGSVEFIFDKVFGSE